MAHLLFVPLHLQKQQDSNRMEALIEKIIITASELFALYGLKSITIDDICRKMGISKKTFYESFTTKEELVDAVLERKDKLIGEQFKSILESTDGNAIDELLAFMNMHRLWASTNQDKHPAMLHDLQKYYITVWTKSIERKEKRVKDFFIHNTQKGISEGLYRAEIDIDMLGVYFGFNQTLKLFENLNCLKEHKLTNQRIANFIIELMTRYITTPLGWDYLMTKINEEKQKHKKQTTTARKC
ncbi:MAG: TetR/AcrR family transcriptional regulator [Paludibacteraceae bacterium]|nr:TetR/AcrR family transcriptional regulator [Paludibacteraceae bacterium]